MVQTILVYSFMMASMVILGLLYTRDHPKEINFYNPFVFAIIIIYSVLCGLRFKVGVDYESYYSTFLDYQAFGFSNAEISQEPGWLLFTKIIASNGFHFSIYFGIIAFLQIWFIVFAFKKHPQYLPYIILFFFFGQWQNFYLNVLRQAVTVSILLYIMVRYPKISFWKLIIFTLMSMTIHKSAIIFLPVAVLFRIHWQKPKLPVLLVLVYLFCIILGLKVNIMSIIEQSPITALLLSDSPYEYYLMSNNFDGVTQSSLGIGYLILIIVNCLIILCSCKTYIIDYNNYLKYFYIYFIGECLTAMFPTSILLTRPLLYMKIFMLPLFAIFTISVLKKIKTTSSYTMSAASLYGILGLLAIVSFASILNTSSQAAIAYRFIWD